MTLLLLSDPPSVEEAAKFLSSVSVLPLSMVARFHLTGPLGLRGVRRWEDD